MTWPLLPNGTGAVSAWDAANAGDAPDLAFEVAAGSASYHLYGNEALYAGAGVPEYAV